MFEEDFEEQVDKAHVAQFVADILNADAPVLNQHADRIRENFASTTCKLESEDGDVIEEVGKKYLKRFNDPSESWEVSLFEGLNDSQ